MSNNNNQAEGLSQERIDYIFALLGVEGYKLPTRPKVSMLELAIKSLKENYGIEVADIDDEEKIYDAHNKAEKALFQKLYKLTTRKVFLGLSEIEQRDFIKSNSGITDDKYLKSFTEIFYNNLYNKVDEPTELKPLGLDKTLSGKGLGVENTRTEFVF